MNTAPNRLPSRIARIAQGNGKPSMVPSAPVTIVVICMLEPNQMVKRLLTAPWR